MAPLNSGFLANLSGVLYRSQEFCELSISLSVAANRHQRNQKHVILDNQVAIIEERARVIVFGVEITASPSRLSAGFDPRTDAS
jgi:hypothetical protein